MKIEVTKKAVNNAYDGRVYQVGYCDLQHLFWSSSPFGYHAGVYGWNCDMYELHNTSCVAVCVETGYRPSGIKVPYKLVSKYDNKAKAIIDNGDNISHQLENLKMDFAEELLKL